MALTLPANAAQIIAKRIELDVAFTTSVQRVSFAKCPVWRNLRVGQIRDALDLSLAICFNDLVATAFLVECVETGVWRTPPIETCWAAFRLAFPLTGEA